MSYLSGALPGTMEEWELVAKGAYQYSAIGVHPPSQDDYPPERRSRHRHRSNRLSVNVLLPDMQGNVAGLQRHADRRLHLRVHHRPRHRARVLIASSVAALRRSGNPWTGAVHVDRDLRLDHLCLWSFLAQGPAMNSAALLHQRPGIIWIKRLYCFRRFHGVWS